MRVNVKHTGEVLLNVKDYPSHAGADARQLSRSAARKEAENLLCVVQKGNNKWSKEKIRQRTDFKRGQ